MDDTTTLPAADAPQPPAPTAPTNPAATGPAAPHPLGDFEGKLERIIEFVKILNDNPAIHSLLCVLLGINPNKPST